MGSTGLRWRGRGRGWNAGTQEDMGSTGLRWRGRGRGWNAGTQESTEKEPSPAKEDHIGQALMLNWLEEPAKDVSGWVFSYPVSPAKENEASLDWEEPAKKPASPEKGDDSEDQYIGIENWPGGSSDLKEQEARCSLEVVLTDYFEWILGEPILSRSLDFEYLPHEEDFHAVAEFFGFGGV